MAPQTPTYLRCASITHIQWAYCLWSLRWRDGRQNKMCTRQFRTWCLELTCKCMTSGSQRWWPKWIQVLHGPWWTTTPKRECSLLLFVGYRWIWQALTFVPTQMIPYFFWIITTTDKIWIPVDLCNTLYSYRSRCWNADLLYQDSAIANIATDDNDAIMNNVRDYQVKVILPGKSHFSS